MLAEGRLLERDAELVDLRRGLAALQEGRGAFVLVQGPAGIGKTTLVQRLGEEAADAGVRVLRATGSELERDFPFGVVQQLLTEVVRHPPEGLRIGEAARGVFTPEDRVAASPQAMLSGLFWCCADLADRCSVLFVVDDAQWADEASLHFLEFLARRIADLPILLAVAERPAEADAGAAAASLAALAALPAALVVAPPPLSTRAVAALLEDALGDGLADAALATAATVTGGNPLLVAELGAELRRTGQRAPDEAAVRSAVSGSLRRTVAARLRRLGPEAVAVARALATLGHLARPSRLAALAELPTAVVVATLDDLARSGVLDEPATGFAHPMVREAVSAETPSAAARAAHRRAARLLQDEHEPDEVVAAHLAAADPAGDEAAAVLLADVGARATADGAPELGRRLLARALAEPPAVVDRPRVLVALGRAELSVGHTRAALAHLDEAIKTGDPTTVARAELDRAAPAREAGREREVVDGLAAALAAIDPDDDALATRLTERLLEAQLFVPERVADRAQRLEALDVEQAEPALLAHLAYHLAVTHKPQPDVIAAARRAWTSDTFFDAFHWGEGSPFWVNEALCAVEAADDARRFLAAAVDAAARTGSPTAVAYVDVCRTHAEWRFGDLRRAEDHARAALATFEPLGLVSVTNFCLASLAQVRLDRGDVDDADALLARLTADAPAVHLSAIDAIRGRVHLARGRSEAALDAVQRQWTTERRHGLQLTTREHTRALHVAALAAAGRSEEAVAAAATALGSAAGRGMAGVTTALLLARSRAEDRASALQTLEEAVEASAASALPLVRARALVASGAALRREGRRAEARERLRAGWEQAHALGAEGLEKAAFDELQVAGARPHRVPLAGRDALTASELRTAELAAAGLTNREIAEQLFVTIKTVEAHLGRAYGKLDIRSRAELANRLDAGDAGEV